MTKKNFKNFGEFSSFFKRTFGDRRSTLEMGFENGLIESAAYLKIKAQEKFGHYQEGWEELAEATKKDRVRKGFTPNNPLFRTGWLRNSVEVKVAPLKASIGSNEKIMIYQEKGTTRTGWKGARGIPPRPVFLITAEQEGPEAVKIFVKNFIKKIHEFS